MKQIGIYFGTDSGTTRLISKKIARKLKSRLGDEAISRPVNVNRTQPEEMLAHSLLILGTPTYGKGELPGKASNNNEESWLEFLPKLENMDFSEKKIALFGLGDQEEYPDHFLDAMRELYDFFCHTGAELIGSTPVEGFEFNQSRSMVDGRFVGLAIDHHLQHLLTDERIDQWLDLIEADLEKSVKN